MATRKTNIERPRDLSIALLPLLPVPEPRVHDAFSYLLAAVCPDVFSYWMNSYWGGSVAGLGGAFMKQRQEGV